MDHNTGVTSLFHAAIHASKPISSTLKLFGESEIACCPWLACMCHHSKGPTHAKRAMELTKQLHQMVISHPVQLALLGSSFLDQSIQF